MYSTEDLDSLFKFFILSRLADLALDRPLKTRARGKHLHIFTPLLYAFNIAFNLFTYLEMPKRQSRGGRRRAETSTVASQVQTRRTRRRTPRAINSQLTAQSHPVTTEYNQIMNSHLSSSNLGQFHASDTINDFSAGSANYPTTGSFITGLSGQYQNTDTRVSPGISTSTCTAFGVIPANPGHHYGSGQLQNTNISSANIGSFIPQGQYTFPPFSGHAQGQLQTSSITNPLSSPSISSSTCTAFGVFPANPGQHYGSGQLQNTNISSANIGSCIPQGQYTFPPFSGHDQGQLQTSSITNPLSPSVQYNPINLQGNEQFRNNYVEHPALMNTESIQASTSNIQQDSQQYGTAFQEVGASNSHAPQPTGPLHMDSTHPVVNQDGCLPQSSAVLPPDPVTEEFDVMIPLVHTC
ncbi:uncharacterized protein LOC128557882 isoform X2 [Mercenaria mercenaria]|uniref:uncharacterized protein LOC128557882 isoform X2 n=1 Tax=Mercenaria mercenaria TaxID=6596 RepID=UPI00234EFE97|nr:uncharacterized protein LOC128557882 isoform X2 [Mercenaria mercenaria]